MGEIYKDKVFANSGGIVFIGIYVLSIMFFSVGMMLSPMLSYGRAGRLVPSNITDTIPKTPAQVSTKTIKGIVRDNKGLVVPGATVRIKGTKIGMMTDEKGGFKLEGVKETDVLLVTLVGYHFSPIVVGDRLVFSIKLEPQDNMLKDVVVTGMFERKKESFTGTTATFTGQQLRNIGTKNVIQSLRSLDPSFAVIDNKLSGSNPNALATIELRGKTSVNSNLNTFGVVKDQLVADPNQPLFILDGFESTLQQITDLDMNRIASITLLKDAASTAIYGSRSANGVVVVETIKPKAGELQITYAGDFSVDLPNLNSYSLMNAAQKLEFERLAGRYSTEDTEDATTTANTSQEVPLQRLYNSRLKSVLEGVNTYWLNVPLRTGFSQKHSLYVAGGSTVFQYGVGLDEQETGGVMKGSDRSNWSGRVYLNYRTGNLNVSDQVFVNGTKASDSPYGSFSNYAAVNPYYRKDITGRYLEVTVGTPTDYTDTQKIKITNPLYNARLNSTNSTKNTSIQNNLMFNWDVNKALRLSGSLQLSKSFQKTVNFVSPEDTQFDETTILEKGTYNESHGETFSYDGNLMLTYNNTFGKKHVFTANARGEAQQNDSRTTGFAAVGFPVGVPGSPSFAYQYMPNSKPSVTMPPVKRRVSVLASANYVFDNRYFLDATYRIDGATIFGSNNKYSNFWSVGLGWNIQHEKFMQKVSWLNRLILRTNRGSTGNQDFGSFASATVYDLQSVSSSFGQGYFHTDLGNPDLQWQKTVQTDIGLDFSIFGSRFSGSINAYDKLTSPLIISINLPGSNGLSGYPINTGHLTVLGIEADFSYNIINNINKRTLWSVSLTGTTYKSTYGGFNSQIAALNSEAQQSLSIIRYKDGHSPDDIWMVPSVGIDPANGEELFRKKNGSLTYDYDQNDERVVGSQRPKLAGVLSSSLRLQGLTLGISIRYNLGSSQVNTDLYNKVENIDFAGLSSNQDIRALESRWKKPGDVAQFKGISLNDQVPLSSRFVQKENIITGDSFSAGYEFDSQTNSWLKAVHIKSLRFTGYLNDIFRLSNVQVERGTDYPFTNTVSLSVNALF